MSKLITFVKESFDEVVHKVTWPTTKVLLSSSITVLTATVILSLLIFVMDFGFGNTGGNNALNWDGLLGLFYK